MLLLAVLWLSPLAAWSRTSFAPHMLLHVGVVSIAAPLLALGLAGRVPGPATFRSALSWCLLAGFAEFVAVWIWHAPILHDLAARDNFAFALEQASFLLGSLGLWLATLASWRRDTAPAGAIALFLTFAHMSLFGLLLTLAPRLLYDPDLCAGAFGLDRLDNQHLGGAIMLAGGLAPLTGALVSATRAVRRSDRDAS